MTADHCRTVEEVRRGGPGDEHRAEHVDVEMTRVHAAKMGATGISRADDADLLAGTGADVVSRAPGGRSGVV